jgi:predicted thioesterase
MASARPTSRQRPAGFSNWMPPVALLMSSRALACRAVNIAIGLKGEARLVVGEGDTALALGSGDVEVLGTPRLVALIEQATVEALTGVLEPGQSSVGMRVQIDHLQPTPVGAEIVAEAHLEKIEGRRISFTVTASDSGGLAAAGKVTRVIVDIDRFMSKCCKAD